MACTTYELQGVPTVTVSDIGFAANGSYLDGDCKGNIGDVEIVDPIQMGAKFSASVKCRGKVTLQWDLDGVTQPAVIIAAMTFFQGTYQWYPGTGVGWVAGTYSNPTIVVSDLVAV